MLQQTAYGVDKVELLLIVIRQSQFEVSQGAGLNNQNENVDDPDYERHSGKMCQVGEKLRRDVHFLQIHRWIEQKKVAEPQIGLIGHSEGGVIAPIAAAKSRDVAYIIMMAGLGQTGRDAILMQNDLLTRASGLTPEIINQTFVSFRVFRGSFFCCIRTTYETHEEHTK